MEQSGIRLEGSDSSTRQTVVSSLSQSLVQLTDEVKRVASLADNLQYRLIGQPGNKNEKDTPTASDQPVHPVFIVLEDTVRSNIRKLKEANDKLESILNEIS